MEVPKKSLCTVKHSEDEGIVNNWGKALLLFEAFIRRLVRTIIRSYLCFPATEQNTLL